MQALEVSIPGSYWDSLLYDGNLYLFTRQGDITIHNWDRLVGSMAWEADAKPLAVQYLTRGKAWYSPALRQLLRSPSTKAHLTALTDALTSKRHIAPSGLVEASRSRQIESPAYPHTDVETYYNNVYVGGSQGIYEAPLQGDDEGRFQRILDAPSLRIASGYGHLAVAAGSDGLLDHQLVKPRYRGYWGETGVTEEVSSTHCQSVSWARFDIVGSSREGSGGFLAAYSSPKWTDENNDRVDRSLLGIVEADQLFDASGDGYMFAASDQLARVHEGGIEFEAWNPYHRRRGAGVDIGKSRSPGASFQDKRLSSSVLDASAAVFGAIVELDDSLLVLGSDGTTRRFPEPINWRCFPRSTRYINHLHITYPNQVRIFAFVHDYFQAKGQGPGTGRPRVTDENALA